MLDLLIYLKV